MRIADILRGKGSTVATVHPSATLAELIGELARHNVGALPVVDDDGQLVGIVSERDVVRQLHAHGAEVLHVAVVEFMTPAVTTCSPGDKVADLARVMTDRPVPAPAGGRRRRAGRHRQHRRPGQGPDRPAGGGARAAAVLHRRLDPVPELRPSGTQNAASGSSISALSAVSMIARSALSRGSTVLAKNRAAPTLPS